MAWQPNFRCNESHPASGAWPFGDTGGAFWSLLQTLETAGWTVAQSGDHISIVDPGNVFTSCTHTFQGGLVAGDWSNYGSWFVVQMPGSNLQICVWRDTTNAWASQSFFQIKISPTGFTDNALRTNAHPPNAADEQAVWGTLPAVFANLMTSGTDQYAHAAANDAAVNGVYSWYLMTKDQGANNLRSLLFFDGAAIDPITADTTGVLTDPQPWKFYCASGTTSANYTVLRAVGTAPFGYRDHGGGTELWTTFPCCHYVGDAGSLVAPRNLAQQVDGYVRGLPIPLYSSAAGAWGGFLNSVRWNPLVARGYPDRDNPDSALDTGPKLYLGDLLLPWKKTTVPL
jgi:hypothetical protein